MLDISACLLHIKNGFSIILWPGLFKGKTGAYRRCFEQAWSAK
jgi:glycogen debranching enzyme